MTELLEQQVAVRDLGHADLQVPGAVTELLEQQVAEAWRQARERAEAAGRPVTPGDYLLVDDPPAAWARAVEFLRGVLAEEREYGLEGVAERFRVPPDYDAFRRIEGRVWESAGPPLWVLLNAQGVSPYHRDDFRWRPDNGLWLVIAECYRHPDENHRLLLCCDQRHPLFGAVVLGCCFGCPYRDGVPSAKCRVVAPSFREYLRRAEGFRPPDDLLVPAEPGAAADRSRE